MAVSGTFTWDGEYTKRYRWYSGDDPLNGMMGGLIYGSASIDQERNEITSLPVLAPGSRVGLVRINFSGAYGTATGELLYQSPKIHLPQGTYSIGMALKVTAALGDTLATENINCGFIPNILGTDFPCSLSMTAGVAGNIAAAPWTVTCYQDLISGSSNRPESNNTAYAANQNLRHAWFVGGVCSLALYDMGSTHGTAFTGICELWAMNNA